MPDIIQATRLFGQIVWTLGTLSPVSNYIWETSLTGQCITKGAGENRQRLQLYKDPEGDFVAEERMEHGYTSSKSAKTMFDKLFKIC